MRNVNWRWIVATTIKVALPLALVGAASSARGAWATKLDVTTYRADSAALWSRQNAREAGQDTLLRRIDQRVTDMWCADSPAKRQRACRDTHFTNQ